jgi:predicted enzyme related to lactoylglutathione lyase
MITHVKLTTVYVSDQDKALDFYTNKLGFEVRADETMGEMRWIEVGPKGAATSIVLKLGNEGPSAERIGQFTEIALEADDIEATYRELSSRGVEFTEKPNRQPWGMQAQFVDQDGNRFALGQEGD